MMHLVDICRRNTGEIVWDCSEILSGLHLFSHLWFEKDEWRWKAAEKLCWDSQVEEKHYVSSRLRLSSQLKLPQLPQLPQATSATNCGIVLRKNRRQRGPVQIYGLCWHLNKWRKGCGNRNWVILSHGRNLFLAGVIYRLVLCWHKEWWSGWRTAGLYSGVLISVVCVQGTPGFSWALYRVHISCCMMTVRDK